MQAIERLMHGKGKSECGHRKGGDRRGRYKRSFFLLLSSLISLSLSYFHSFILSFFFPLSLSLPISLLGLIRTPSAPASNKAPPCDTPVAADDLEDQDIREDETEFWNYYRGNAHVQ